MWIDHLSYFLAGIMLMLTVMGMVLAGTMPGIERWNRRFFLFLFTALTLLITITTIDLIIYRSPGIPRVKAVVWYLESVLNSFPMFFFPFFLLHCCGERWQASRLIHANLLLWITYFVLLGVNQFTHLFYYAAQDGMFSRGPWYPLAIAPMDVMMLLNLAGVIRRRRLISGKYFRIFLIYLVPLSAAMVVHTFLYIPMFFYVGLVISTFSMFAIILMDQVDQYLRQSQEIAAQRARITVLQMRPHFIFNTMMALYSLCGISPEKAQKVMLNFTTYLRKNFSASHRKRIPTIIFSTNGIKDGWHAMNMTTRSGTNRNRTFACRSEAGISFPHILNILQVSHEIAPTAAVYPMMW
jgi:hypothetical protein